MAVRIDLLSSTNLTNIDTNFQRLKEAIEDSVSRSGNVPNHMNADLDMNGFNIINAGNIDGTPGGGGGGTGPVNAGDVIGIQEYIEDTIGSSLVGGPNVSTSYDDVSGETTIQVDIPPVITDHGQLTGLSDDDHPQYFNATRGDARYHRIGNASFDEAVEDLIGDSLIAGTNVTINYNDGTGKTTINATGGDGTGVTVHSGLSGLNADDHPQYHNDARGDVRYYTKAQVDSLIAPDEEEIAPYLGVVTTGQRTNDSYNSTFKQMMSRTRHIPKQRLTELQLVYANWATGDAGDEPNFGNITVRAAIEYPIGTFTPVPFNGSTATRTITGGATQVSDKVFVNIPEGVPFFVRTYMTAANGIIWSSRLDVANGESSEYGASGISDKTVSGVVGNTGGDAAFRPIAIIAQTTKPTALLVGDSKVYGTGDDFDFQGSIGSIGRSIEMDSATINVARNGDRAVWFVGAHDKRVSLAQYVSHVIVSYAGNDLNNGRTGAQVISDLGTIASYFTNKTVIVATSEPWTSNGAGTTPASWNGQRVIVNNAIRSGIAGYDKYFEIADIFETSRNSGVWKSGYVSDGIHPNIVAARAARDSKSITLVEAPSSRPNTLNPRDYGAFGNGNPSNAAADTAGLTAALSVLCRANQGSTSEYTTLDLNGGQYILNGPIVAPTLSHTSSIRITNGSLRFHESVANGTAIFLDMSPISTIYQMRIDNINFIGVTSGNVVQARGAIKTNTGSGIYITNNEIKGFTEFGVQQASTNFGQHMRIMHNLIQAYVGTGTFPSSSIGVDLYGGDNWVDSNTIGDCGTLVRLRQSANQVIDNHLWNFSTTSLNGVICDVAHGITIVGNYVDTVQLELRGSLNGGTQYDFHGNIITGNKFYCPPDGIGGSSLFTSSIGFIKYSPTRNNGAVAQDVIEGNVFSSDNNRFPMNIQYNTASGTINPDSVDMACSSTNKGYGVTMKYAEPEVTFRFVSAYEVNKNVSNLIPFGRIRWIKGWGITAGNGFNGFIHFGNPVDNTIWCYSQNASKTAQIVDCRVRATLSINTPPSD